MEPAADRTVAGLVAWLRAQPDCTLEDGLDAGELDRAEGETAVRFPPRWREVLALVHPVATGRVAYPDWRLRDASAARLVAAPVAGVLFDVEHNDFWWPGWGERPPEPASALDAACAQLAAAPRLVPLRGHWYTGSHDGDPVLSIVQTDLYARASSLIDLVGLVGLADPGAEPAADPVADRATDGADGSGIPFWSELHAWSQRA